jgi:disulfide bond formation protein DsbB
MSIPAARESLPVGAGGARSVHVWAWAALLVATLGLAGSLFLSLGLGLQACPLCFYQRAFVMAVAAVLAAGLLFQVGRTGELALPLAVAGLGVGAYHVALELTGSLECPAGVLSLGTAPQQSLVMFVLLSALLAADALQQPAAVPGDRHLRGRATGLIVGAVLGGLMTVASTVANPPPRRLPPEVYARPPEVCRPPL